MRRWAMGLAACTVGLVCVAGPATSATAKVAGSVAPDRAFYLALGDSAPVWNGHHSYPNLIVGHERKTRPGLSLVKMACSDETSASMVAGSTCAPGGSQLDEAEAFLRSHQRSVPLVTIDIGGNDIVFCASPHGLDLTCVAQAEAVVRTNLATILQGLRAAAGPTTLIVGMTYYDPLLGDWLAGGATRQVALDTVPVLVAFNDMLAASYTQPGDLVADVQGAYAATDLSDRVASRWGSIPVAVDRACTHLDIRCHTGRAEGFGDDPNRAGAVIIASAFEHTIGAL